MSGTPSASDRGLLLLNVTAKDDLGNTLMDPIAIHVGDIKVAIPISNQQVYVGNSTMLSLPAGTFEFPNAAFTYTATLVGGLPLPPFINFDPETRTFLFTPHLGDQNSYRIQATGDDGYGGTISTTFDLSVPDRPPVLAQPLGNQTAYTGEFFEYIVASSSFADADNDQLAFSANLVGSSVLPGWLGFDPALRRFYGTPFGRNTYQIQMNANDGFGGVVSGTFTITIPNSAPILLNPIGTQLASVGIPFSYTFYSSTFYDVDGDALTYSTSSLPAFLSFNPATRTFTGTPQIQDTGTTSITLSAQDPLGAKASATFTLTVLSSTSDLPPVLVLQIPDMTITSGIPFNTTFNKGTFEDPQNQPLTYTATLEGGSPLPDTLHFDPEAFSMSGVVTIPQTLRITIKATDPYGGFAVDTFAITAIDGTKYPPIVLNPLPDEIATVGVMFRMQVPENTFKDLSGDSLTIAVIQAGGLPLPGWLKWDPVKHSFSGTPGPFDTNTYANKEHTIEVWAADGTGSVKTSFKITVNGESFWATFIKYGFSFVSIAGTGLGLWKSRALIWNHFRQDKYRQKEPERAVVGEQFERKISLDFKRARVRVYHKDILLDKMPDDLVYKNDQLKGVPTTKSVGRYTIRIYDQDGYINEEFDLFIKNNANDADPIEKTGYMQTKFASFSNTCLPQDDDEENGKGNCFGSKRGDSSIMMQSLLSHQNKELKGDGVL